MASEEFASRMASPRPQSGRPASISGKSASAPSIQSPLSQANFPADALKKQDTQEDEDEEVIHIDPPSRRESKIHGGGYDPPTEDLGPKGGNTEEEGGWVSERGYGVPILASDEIEKHPEAEYRLPAVSPELERSRSGEYTVNEDGTPQYITKPRAHSRDSSRNNSMSGVQRFIPSPAQFDKSGTPLESTKEYEPLFPEDEAPKKAKSSVDKLKRPDLARHHFPSQDVWEDSPSSHHLETTVETPQAPEEPGTPGDVGPAKVFEKPESEQARKECITKEDQQSFLPEHTKRFANKNLNKEHLAALTRPGMQQRFPSQDIWEDAPESHSRLETIVTTPQMEETGEHADDSPVVEKPTIPARPSIPARPAKAKEISPVEKKGPVLPERPKPQVPSRPSKPLTKSSEKVPTLDSQENTETAPQPKAKPPVPSRPAGSKIAALQAGFLKDLNNKLGLGPQAPKVKEPEPEKEEEPPKPLQDARKGRAKGPQRRKPTSSPSPAAAATVTAEVAVPRQKLEIAPITTVFSIGDDLEVDVPAAQMAAKLHAVLMPSEEKEEPKASEDVLEREVHVDPGEADLEKTTIKEAEPSSADVPKEALDEPIEGQTAGKSEPITADPAEVEVEVEDKVEGGVSLSEKKELEEEIRAEASEKLEKGGGEEAAKDATPA